MNKTIELKKSRLTAGSYCLAATLAGAILLAVFFQTQTNNNNIAIPASIANVVMTSPIQLRPFSLIDQHGQNFDIERFKQQWTFMVFGYMQCPDICPATLSQLATIHDKISAQVSSKQAAQFVFVSVDPDRDKVADLAEYIPYFDKSFIALTGSIGEIKKLEHQLEVTHRYGRKNQQGEYSVTHSAYVFLVDPQGTVVAKFLPPLSSKGVLKQYLDLKSYIKNSKQSIST